VYLAYSDYIGLGGGLPEGLFNRAVFTAEKKIDAAVPRLREEWDTAGTDIVRAVKMLTLELIERGLTGSPDGKDVTSVSNSGYSESYESRAGKADELMKEYLAGLMFEDGTVVHQGDVYMLQGVHT
jgi:hypothetical protein